LRRCPECNSLFPDTEHFCEADGTPLVTVEDAPRPLSNDRTVVVPRAKSGRGLLPIGALACFLLGVLLALIYVAMSRQTTQENPTTTSSSSSAPQQVVTPSRPLTLETASPSPEPSVEPSASPSVETPTPENSSASQVVSSSNPISTAPGPKGSSNPVIIRLNSGLTIEADEAWQTAEGIWYRKNSVVSLLDPKNVKAIEKVSPPAPQPSASPSP
jgi:cytoskeletal protein RodZ